MRVVHYRETDIGYPACGVYKGRTRTVTNVKEDVTCRSCIRWIVHITHDTSYFDKIYS